MYAKEDQHLDPEQREAAKKVDEMIRAVQAGLAGMRDQWVRHRAQSGVEDRWRRAKILYEGSQAQAEAAFLETLKTGPARRMPPQQRSRLVVNIVQPKVDQAVARMCEILLPTDGKNWGLRATPVPEAISKMLGDYRPTVIPGSNTPTGLTAHQEASAYMAAVEQAREGMEKAIDDDLQEGAYNAELRRMIEDGVKLGTGIIFGPLPTAKVSSSWQYQGGAMRKVESRAIVPRSMRVDPWDVWFDPACGNDHRRGAGVWMLKRATRKEIRALSDAPGFVPERVAAVLNRKPTRTTTVNGRVTRTNGMEETYELWTYYGSIEPEQMTLCSWGSNGDPLEDVDYGVIVMCEDQVLGALPFWNDDREVPCDVWCYRESDESPHGFGLPDALEHQQAALIAAWRQIMDNGRNASGGQIVIADGIEPADGSTTITPNKLWRAKSGVTDVTKAFAVFNFNAHLQEMLAIADAAMKFADTEANMPQILGGEKGNAAPETLGGMVMLFSNASAVIRYRCKRFDDRVTWYHIGRYFDWQMMFNPDDSIKGDMEIIPLGSTALLERDIANQGALNMANVTSNERYIPFVDPKKELKIILKAMRQKPEDIMYTDEELAEKEEQAKNAPPQEDPQVLRAKAIVQAKEMDVADRKEQRQFDAQVAADQTALKRDQMQLDREKESARFDLGTSTLAMQRELEISKMQQDGIENQAERESRERMQAIDLDRKGQLFNAEAAIKLREGSGI
jgi:hypothetical protein